MPAAPAPALVWFRDDLRLADNPALTHAIASGRPVLALFVFDDGDAGQRRRGAASRWWLAQSLRQLARAIAAKGGRLILRSGAASHVVPGVAGEVGARLVTWNRRYEAAAMAVDAGIKTALTADHVVAESFSAALLREPSTVKSRAGQPMQVFTPFWRAHQAKGEPRAALPEPVRISGFAGAIASEDLDDWGLEPRSPDWAAGFGAAWQPGEAGARARLLAFLDNGLASYAETRDRPDLAATSRLSPHLRFGEISAVQIWHAARLAAELHQPPGLPKFLSEVGWREFAYHLLYHRPDLARENVRKRFDGFAWTNDPAHLLAWQRGLTGYPLVDAGMRELWRTGWMHNRVRMVAASFLVKHLKTDWRAGEAWFWDTLVDADPANNAASWQWVAGSSADAAPFFRIFNPMAQAQTFDPAGDYVRRWVPELAGLPAGAIHQPWTAAAADLAQAGVTLGVTYPRPIVDHARAREQALAAFAELEDVEHVD
ncbi:cryptochrome/photolyase family protein [Phreatobacter stygius]|uniref:Deoxyribodipyrimidine photo-lyase n=1 Tax=Phreatobacter stygius TaxID=1940610 RepID=A0A4D7BG59_9HYPH|nr:deoxyribodipyrimidine photo-lyase [Phreatobacter stygius]QCI69565.1 deoxyribodipyrimidine photo-lyase [Phreatobacter stygius]